MADNKDVIQELQLKISGESRSAQDSIKTLTSKLENLKSVLTSFPTGNNIATQIQGIANATKSIDVNGINTLTSALRSMSKVDASVGQNLAGIASGLRTLSGISLSGLAGLSAFADGVNKLGYQATSQALVNLPMITVGISNLSATLAGLTPEAGANLTAVANSIATFGHKAGSQAVANIPMITQGMRELVKEIGSIPNDKEAYTGLSEMVTAVSRLGYKTGTNAADNLPKLAQGIRDLFNELRDVRIDPETIRALEAVSNLKIGNLRSALVGASGGSGKSGHGSIFKSLFSSFGKGKNDAKSFAHTMGQIYAKFWALIRVARLFGKSINISSDLTEVQNVVDQTFGDFRYKLDNLLTEEVGMEQYGLGKLQGSKIASQFQAMGVAAGFTQDKMSDMSIELTKLAADMGSFFNQDYEEVATKLQSIFTGTTKPLRSFGLDLTNATIESWALTQGLDVQMKKLSQADKIWLRYQYVMSQTGHVQGDFARTSWTWANQLRILKINLQDLGATFGTIMINIFRPFIQALNNVMGAVKKFVTNVLNALGQIFGWQYQEGGGAALDDYVGGVEDLDDGLGSAADNAKKLQANLQGFDRLNVLTSDKDKNKGSGGGLGLADDFEAEAGKFVRKEPEWKQYVSDIKTLEDLGRYLNETVNGVLKSIPWDEVKEKARSFGEGFADLLNGFNENPETFYLAGQTIAETINTIGEALRGFGDNAHWKTYGENLGYFVNGIAENIDWELAYHNAETYGVGLAEYINGFFETVNGIEVGKSVGNALNVLIRFGKNFTMTLDAKQIGDKLADAFNGLAGSIHADELGELLADAINLPVEFANGFVKKLDAKKIGKKVVRTIGSFFDNIKYGEIADLIGNIADGILDFMTGAVEEVDWGKLPGKIAKKFIEILEGHDWVGTFKKAGNLIKKIGEAIWSFLTSSTKLEFNGKELEIPGIAIALALAGISLLFSGAKYALSAAGLGKLITSALGAGGAGAAGTAGAAALGTSLASLFTIGATLAVGVKFISDWNDYTEGYETATGNDAGFLGMGALFDFSDEGKAYKQSVAAGKESRSQKPSARALDRMFGTNFTGEVQEDANRLGAEVSDNVKAGVESKPTVWDSFRDFFGKMMGKTKEDATTGAQEVSNEIGTHMQGIGMEFEDLQKTVAEQTGLVINSWNDMAAGSYVDATRIRKHANHEKTSMEIVKKAADSNIGPVPVLLDNMADAAENLDNKVTGAKTATQNLTTKVKNLLTYDGKDVNFTANLHGFDDANAKLGSAASYIQTLKNGTNIVINITARTKFTLAEDAYKDISEGWLPGNHYASGGFVESGQLFQAREAGPELVGTIGNRTAVVNNDQIVQSVALGVAGAVRSTLAPYLANGQNVNVNLVGDARGIFKVVQNESNAYRARTGRLAFG